MNTLFLSWKNLVNKPLSTLLSILLFALGVGLISLLLLLNHQLEQKFNKNLAGTDLVIGAKGSPLQLILSSMFHVDVPTGNISLDEAGVFLRPEHPLIQRSVPLALGDSYRAYRIVGTTHNIISLYGAEIAEGRLWETPMETVLGVDAARELQLDIGDRFQSTHGLGEDENLVHDEADAFVVTGILEPSGTVVDQLILTSAESIWQVHEHSSGEEPHLDPEVPLYQKTDQDITALLIKFKNNKSVPALNMPRAINENTNMMAANPAYEISKLFDQIGVGERILRAIAVVIIAVSSFSIFIALFNSLRERRYELAIMRTLGASPARVFSLIIVEGLILAGAGCLAGLMLSHVGMEVFSEYLQDAYRYRFTGWIFLKEEWFLILGGGIIGFIAAFIPAWQAKNTDIHRTLAES